MSGPRILTLDIETSPNIAHVWGLFNQNVGLPQLIESSRMMCWAAKWHGDKRVHFSGEFWDTHEDMVKYIHALMDQADVIQTYNGDKFDIPILNREIVMAGLTPPAPSKSLDLYKVVKRKFRFTSGKLQHVSTQLGLEGKVQHSGHQLWVDCLAGDEKAWKKMRTYNRQDVVLTEQLGDVLMPWVESGPHRGLYADDPTVPTCERCGGTELQRRGVAHTRLSVYPRYQCQQCGSWSRGARRLGGADLRGTL